MLFLNSDILVAGQGVACVLYKQRRMNVKKCLKVAKLYSIRYSTYTLFYIFSIFLIPAALFTVNIVNILIPPICVICILLHIPLSMATSFLHFTAYPVCVCDKYNF